MSDAKLESMSFSGGADVDLLNPRATTSNLVEAYVGRNTDYMGADTADIELGTEGGARLDVEAIATGHSVAKSDADNIAGSLGVNVADLTSEATLLGATRAYVGTDTDLYAGNVTLSASEATAQANAIVSGGSSISLT